MEGVSVRSVGSPSELSIPDLLIIPGTKATMADFMTLMLADKAEELGGSGSSSGKKNDLDLSDLGTLLSGTLGKLGKK